MGYGCWTICGDQWQFDDCNIYTHLCPSYMNEDLEMLLMAHKLCIEA